MIIYKDEAFGFYELFNEENGTLIRSDVNGIDPIMRSFPELIDVGVMGHCDSGIYCKQAGVDCYQRGNSLHTPHMTVENFQKLARQACGKTFQFALGGAGDPNHHPQFEELLQISRRFRIVPNLTTSGFLMTDTHVQLMRQYCGAVAVSWYSRLKGGQESNPETLRAVQRLVQGGCITNLHYVVSTDTIDEAIFRLQQDSFPCGIHAVIFILYKPVGNGHMEKVLQKGDYRLQTFLSLATEKTHPYRIGFDTCFTPALLNQTRVPSLCVDACEAATFSMYIDSQMNCYPCSFGVGRIEISASLNNQSLREIWNGEVFRQFRQRKKNTCIACDHYQTCRDGCRLGLPIDLCSTAFQ